MDMIYIGAIVAFVAICWALTVGCAKLRGEK
ncbi:MAG: hypothetical protein JWR56_2970 [Massilia sp.]|nr:hypothetical protein [Massilia sp.]